MTDESEKSQEEHKLEDKGYRKPFFPYDARPRRCDGNEVLDRLSKRARTRVRDTLLRFRLIEFFWTLARGPVVYEEDKPRDVPLSPGGVEQLITTYDAERLSELYEHSRELMEREEETRTSVESRANVLLSAGGLTTTLIVGVSGLLARGDLAVLLPPGSGSLAVFLGLYLVALFALIMSLIRAVQAVKVVSYQPFSATRPFEVQLHAPASRFRHLIREAFLTFVDLRLMNSIKVGFLRAAQWWFGAALVLLLTMAAVPTLIPLVGRILGAIASILARLWCQ